MFDFLARTPLVATLALTCCALTPTVYSQLPVPTNVPAASSAIIDAASFRSRQPALGPAVERPATDVLQGDQPRRLPPAADSFPYPQLLRDRDAFDSATTRATLPADFVPWWRQGVMGRQRNSPSAHPVNLDALIVSALAHSSRVRAISEDVLIQETSIVEAEAAFDVHAFMDSKFVRKSQPIGNLLETGGPPRLRELDWRYSAGFRKRTPLGGSWELSQQIGMRDSNSRFFSPEQQGNSRFALSFSQPLLNGVGRAYNTALVVLADIDTTVATDQTAKALEDHLASVAEAYWDLYLQRAVLLQRRRHLNRAKQLLDELVRRRDIDALESQIVRAQAAVASRNAEMVRAATSIRDIEARIRALTNSPQLLANPYQELLPLDFPLMTPVKVSLREAMITALQHRQEVDAATQEIRAASIRLNMSRNELLPALDLVLETYVQGLDADYDLGQALADQFYVGEPSYSAGLVFEFPLDRRVAKARLRRRQLELRQLTEKLDNTVQMLLAEVEVAVREVNASYSSVAGKYQAMKAAEVEVDYTTRRWQLMAGDDRAASFMIDDVLDAQDRLAMEEFGFALAQRDYTISLTHLKRATGTLLEEQQIETVRTSFNGLPELHFEKVDRVATPAEVLPAPQHGSQIR